jgi:hypothetical protein
MNAIRIKDSLRRYWVAYGYGSPDKWSDHAEEAYNFADNNVNRVYSYRDACVRANHLRQLGHVVWVVDGNDTPLEQPT